MKHFFALVSAIAFLCPCLSACSSLIAEETTETVTGSYTQEDDGENVYTPETEEEIVFEDAEPSYLTASQVTSLPLATADMTKNELRKLCVDYFQLQLSFLWKSNLDVTDYPTTNNSLKKSISTENLYGGIPYQSTGTGNLYRWLEYYDEETGVMDLERAFEENGGYGEGAEVTGEKINASGEVTYKKYRSFQALFNQCSVSSFWGWGRVINSADFDSTSDMNVSGGFIPVGLYTYPNMETLDEFGNKTAANPYQYDTKDVIANWVAKNGSDAMAACYALMKPADCLVNEGHAMMVKTVKVSKNNDGSVNHVKSYVKVLEQTESGGEKGEKEGLSYLQQGVVDRVYTFAELQRENYIPFTFAEFLDENDPADKRHLDFYRKQAEFQNPLEGCYDAFDLTTEEMDALVGTEVEKACVFTTSDGKELSVSELSRMVIGSNYTISDVFVTVTDGAGNEILKNIHRTSSASVRQVSMQAVTCGFDRGSDGEYLTLMEGIAALANGKNTVTVSLQLSTGEKLVAYSGTLRG